MSRVPTNDKRPRTKSLEVTYQTRGWYTTAYMYYRKEEVPNCLEATNVDPKGVSLHLECRSLVRDPVIPVT